MKGDTALTSRDRKGTPGSRSTSTPATKPTDDLDAHQELRHHIDFEVEAGFKTRKPTPQPASTEEPLPTDASNTSPYASARRPGTQRGNTISTILPWERSAEDLAAGFLVPQSRRACANPEFRMEEGSTNMSFWRSLPNYAKFRQVHEDTTALLLMLQIAADQQRSKEFSTKFNDLIREMDRLVGHHLNVNPNIPDGMDVSASLGPRYAMTRKGLLSGFRTGGPEAVIDLIESKGYAEYTDYISGVVQHTQVVYDAIQQGKVRSGTDAGFKPLHFIDLGARGYDEKEYTVQGSIITVPDSSIRVFEKYYPRFHLMYTSVFETQAQYVSTYTAFHTSHIDFSLYNHAAWKNEEGVRVEPDALDGDVEVVPLLNNRPNVKRQGHCLPSVDIAEFLLQHKEDSVVLTMDLDWLEWTLVQYMAERQALGAVGEMFIECYSEGVASSKGLFPVPQELRPEYKTLLNTLYGVGLDCLLLHDFLRSKGITTHFWAHIPKTQLFRHR